MRRYRRLLITAIVAFILLLFINIVQAGINRGFAHYLQSKYPKQNFQLTSPVIRLFPLRYELKVYDRQNKLDFLASAVFKLQKANTEASKVDNATKPKEEMVAKQEASFLTYEQIYNDNYLAQKQAKLVSENLRPVLTNAEYKQLIDRYSIQVSQPISIQGEIVQQEQARLLVRFRSQVKDQTSMTENIQKLVKDVQQLNIEGLAAIYCESAVLPRNEASFAQLQIPAQTWQKTKAVANNKETTNERVTESQVQATEVVASGYQYDYFCYTFNHNLAFSDLSADLIQNGLRIKELGGESLERFKRAWNYNYNA